MAGHYTLSSGKDSDPSTSYAALPGTTAMEFVSHNMTPMKTNLAGREITGCHPSRWVYELLNNKFSTCDLVDRARQSNFESHYTWEHTHKLLINGNQSYQTASEYLLSTICLDCHFHFVFRISWDAVYSDDLCSHGQDSWPPRDNVFPWHHLVWVGSEPNNTIQKESTKYYPILARENFVCSAPPCTFQVVLEISEPRLKPEFVKLLLDKEAIAAQLEEARQMEPARYENATDAWAYEAPLNLNTYLKNMLEQTPDNVRSISKRNKRFAVLFGPRCFSIYRHLEFKEEILVLDEGTGIDEGSFTPKLPAPAGGPQGSTEIGSYRAFIEDARAEVQCLIHKAGQAAERPTFCTTILHSHLGCQEIPNVSANASVDSARYLLLGILPHQSRDIVASAYRRQWELIPSRRKELVEALMGVANDSNDELLSDYAITQSSVFDSQAQEQTSTDQDSIVPQALIYLGLSPPNCYSVEALTKAFWDKIAKDPADMVTARSMILVIANSYASPTEGILLDSVARMPFETAAAVLSLDPDNKDIPDHTVIDAAKRKIEKANGPEEKQVYHEALTMFAKRRDSRVLRGAVKELQGLVGMESYSVSTNGFGASRAVNFALPVGLDNIGNTCYLNSLLQYLFTVRPVRDIVLNYDNVKLGLDDESIQARRLGGNKMQMDRGEAVVAHAFVQELATLFQELQTSHQAASRPSQRLANAVLLSTHTLLSETKAGAEPSDAPKPPPLPARPPPSAPTDSPDKDMVHVTVNHLSDSMETGSATSSITLVDQEDAQARNQKARRESTRSGDVSEPILVEETAGEGLDKSINMSGTVSQPIEIVDDVAATKTADPSEADVTMVDVEESETVDQKVLNALEHQKRSSGTDQQDVEEVMGSILNRLQAAIRPTSVDEATGIQLEKIMETFFVTTVNYTKKFGDETYQHEISFDRSITAYPAPEGPCSLYDALGRNFNQQIIEESELTRYTAIRTLPPVLHVLIQRSQSMGSKNGNAVGIPETLYLDRYMDAPHNSDEFRRRVEDWMIAERVEEIKAALIKTEKSGSLSILDQITKPAEPASDAASKVKAQFVKIADDWSFDGPMEADDWVDVASQEEPLPLVKDLPQAPEGISDLEKKLRDMMTEELALKEQVLATHLESQKSVSYRLHAVICHRGHLTSGHYWVWIHDFEDNVWRKYNDANVEENKDTAEVLKTLSTSGEPYYVCYVRDDENMNTHVNVPKRQAPERAERVVHEDLEMDSSKNPGLSNGIDSSKSDTDMDGPGETLK
ncbi:ubiquitin carboxyl-terminal hydrolase [Stachybotrys elegans]|uniref:ubiquitinyl hydrolase 1 n=1 Tax=Stachybotrys elegans TaxID=80388 RepID=A0A8K0WSX8_9HYPO|nr:ubiquitin carboxyl-terminal hydrolase [Stachybotrys elegans]